MNENKRHRPSLRFKLIAGLILLAVFFVLLEYTVRKLYEPVREFYTGGDPDLARLTYSILEDDPDLIWKLQGGLEVKHPRTGRKMRTNALGYRGPEFKMEKETETARVVFLGGSPLFGMGLAEDETIPALLGKRLAGVLPGRQVEVINLAVPGYSSFQGANQAEQLLTEMEPDAVVVGFGLADAGIVNYTDAQVQHSIPKVQRLFGGLKKFLGWSRLFQLIRNLFRSKESRNILGRTSFAGGGDIRITARVPPEPFRANLLRILRKVREAGGHPVLLDANLVNGYARGPLEEIAGQEGVPLLRMRAILEKAFPGGAYTLEGQPKPRRILGLQISGIPGDAASAAESAFLFTVPLGRIRHPPLNRLHINDNGEYLDRQAGDGIFTARFEDDGTRNFEFAPANRMLVDQTSGIYQLFLNNNTFYPLPPPEALEDTGLYYSPVIDFSRPSFGDGLMDFSATLPNEQGARLIAEALVPPVREILKRK
jgi:lysophospholipase L1-like esterase